jgi:hypothetical protein
MRNIGTLAAEADTPGPIGRRPSISCCCASRRREASGWVQVRDLIVIGKDILGDFVVCEVRDFGFYTTEIGKLMKDVVAG